MSETFVSVETIVAQLTAAQSRVEELERRVESLDAFAKDANSRYLKWFHKCVATKKENQELTADNQRLHSLLTDCLPFVERFGEINFRVDADSIWMHQKRLELLEKIKGLQ